MKEIKDGEVALFQGSAKKPYSLKNVGGTYSCSCPAWRNQSTPIDLRTCKHLKKVLGEDFEKTRLGDAWVEKKIGKKSKSKAVAARQKQATKNKPSLLLAHKWDGRDPEGWWVSLKYDGVRAYWNGKDFVSRSGNVYHAPDWFKEDLPSQPLDGELWLDRGEFQKCVSIVRRQDKGEGWKKVKYLVFDAPMAKGIEYAKALKFTHNYKTTNDQLDGLDEIVPLSFERRQVWLNSRSWPDHVEIVNQEECLGVDDLTSRLAAEEKLGGEGLMLRKRESLYENGRSNTLLKVKTFHDAEAVVIGHEPGKGRHEGRLGALLCETPGGVEFGVGTGFSDKERENPPAIGTTITYRYKELTKDEVPKHTSWLREKT